MLGIASTEVPGDTLLYRYVSDDNYTDSYTVSVGAGVSLAMFVECFYTTALFKCERFILNWLVSRPSTDQGASDVAHGNAQQFAAWSVEERTNRELLMCDFQGRTRSWFSVVDDGATTTQLYFGSAVLPKTDRTTGDANLGFVVRALLGFHRVYSILLLYFARRRLQRRIQSE